VNVISIGFDEPSVEVGLLLRPTQSLALHHQQIGRVMRIAPHKTHGIILDQAGNCLRLGFPEDVESYELTPGGLATSGMGEMPKKRCPTCSTLLRVVVTTCPACHHSFSRGLPAYAGELVELPHLTREHQQRTYRRHLRLAFRSEQPPDWAIAQFHHECPHAEPHPDWARGAIFGDTPTEANYAAYWQQLQRLLNGTAAAIAPFLAEFGGGAQVWLATQQTPIQPSKFKKLKRPYSG
jgi:hypothetical protein